jgi:hypothetical protein
VLQRGGATYLLAFATFILNVEALPKDGEIMT